MDRRHFLGLGASTLAYAAASGCATPPAAAPVAAGRAAIGAFGLDLDAGDPAVAPGENFYRHCSAAWLKNNPIPADRTRWGTFDILAAKAEEDVKKIVEDLSATPAAPGTTARKIGDFYRAYMDEAAIEAAGLAPIQGEIAAIAACRTHADLVRFAANPEAPTRLPLVAFISLDQKNPDRYVATVTHAGLGLPEREYYLKTDEKSVDLRAKYVAHVERLLALAGQSDAGAKARRILAVETAIAERHWAVADRRDRDRTYNRRTRAEVIALLDGFPTEAALDALG
ncbi:MAG: M13 family metallopeptidase N-terminal domain-containing protein, partial [Hyphomonadaceae bacterium]|nr:M13 family metallopeptidase N-terminal domain-containing protein [Hyphomonadaceae bacterium]